MEDKKSSKFMIIFTSLPASLTDTAYDKLSDIIYFVFLGRR